MKLRKHPWCVLGKLARHLTAIICVMALAAGDPSLFAMQSAPSPPQAEEEARLSGGELDSLVAPIALYPDPLLSQTLVASTYPLEIVQLHQWLGNNKNLKGDQLSQAAMKQPWDPSVQAMALFPDVVKLMFDNISWMTDLGNAFLAQQTEVMDAVQRMRKKAKDAGKLASNEQMKVETKVIEKEPVIVIQQANPEVIYVPSYDPMYVYGPPAYPYPYYPPGYYAAGMAISFGVGLAIGAAWGHGGWGWGCGWGGGNNVYINHNNNFVNNSNRVNNISNRTGNSNWKHNPQHRGGAPYGNRATARQYGGTARGDSLANRQASARQTQRAGMRDTSARGDFGGRGPGVSDRSAMGRQQGSGGGGDRVGNRQVSNTPRGGSDRSAFSGSGGRSSGSSARASSSRGSFSMGGGGGRRGGGGGRRR